MPWPVLVLVYDRVDDTGLSLRTPKGIGLSAFFLMREWELDNPDVLNGKLFERVHQDLKTNENLREYVFHGVWGKDTSKTFTVWLRSHRSVLVRPGAKLQDSPNKAQVNGDKEECENGVDKARKENGHKDESSGDVQDAAKQS